MQQVAVAVEDRPVVKSLGPVEDAAPATVNAAETSLNWRAGSHMRRSATFRQLVERFQDECRRQQVRLSRDASEDFLLDRITSIAETLGIQPDTALHTHANDLDVTALVAAFKQADEERQREVADASPAVIDLAAAGRLVAALAQVVRCLSLNHEMLTRRLSLNSVQPRPTAPNRRSTAS